MLRTIRAAVGITGLVVLTSCITSERHREVLSANEVLRDQLADIKRNNIEYQNEVRRLEGEIHRMEPLVKDAAYLKSQKALLQSIMDRLPKGGKIPGVETVNIDAGVALRVQGQVLFGSGSAVLSTSGKNTLRQLVTAVSSHDRRVRIDGHTDSDPIRRSKWKSNIELSAARAIAVRAFLAESGVPKSKMAIAGFGEFVPIDPKNKGRNRRVEIVLLR